MFMLKRIKVVTALVTVLTVFTVLEIVIGSLFYRAVRNDRDNFQFNQQLNTQQQQMRRAWGSLVQARVTIAMAGTRFAIRPEQGTTDTIIQNMLTQAQGTLENADKALELFDAGLMESGRASESVRMLKNHYKIYRDTLDELIVLLKAGRLEDYLNVPAQSYQDQLEKSYNTWLGINTGLSNAGIEQNEHEYQRTLQSLFVAGALVLLLIALSWSGIYRILLRPLNRSIEHIGHIADGDLTRTIETEGHSEIAQLARSLHNMQQSLIRTVRSVRDGSDAIFSGASEISSSSGDLSSRTEQQAASLEETAASMEQLTATVRQNADNARQASQLALNASETARRGGTVVDGVVQTMSEIAGSSKKIADITSVIDGIAFQTNILALNAAVEAARAGEQGRGFAVVAGEVRNLAQRSASAAKEIKGLIEESVSRVDTGSVLVESAGKTMSEIVGAVTRVTDIMGEIASASDEQSRGIDQVNSAVIEMDRVTQQNASLVQESAAAAGALEAQAGQLAQAVAVFRISKTVPAADAKNSMESRSSAKMTPAADTKTLPAAMRSDDNWETF